MKAKPLDPVLLVKQRIQHGMNQFHTKCIVLVTAYEISALQGESSLQGTRYHVMVAHRCIIEASIGRRTVQTIETPHSPGHRSNHRAAQEAT
jgi:hypothetical protein